VSVSHGRSYITNGWLQGVDNFVLVLAEAVSAVLCFILVGYMTKPYRYTGESRYIGLPLGFLFLGTAYVFSGLSMLSGSILFVDDTRWLQLLTEAYAFAFLAATYYFSKQPLQRNTRLLWQVTFSLFILAAALSFLIVVVPPPLTIPSYETADIYFRVFNMLLAAYVSVHTLRSHALRPDPKTIWIPLAYVLFAFSQYSLLIWALDSSLSALAGALLIRLAGLVVFLFVSYSTLVVSPGPHEAGKGP
jgi:hypothetical protein